MFFRCAVALVPVLVIIALRGAIGYLVWSEVPDLQSVFGIGIIILTGLYTLHREMVRRAERSR
jgi:drug/metabolite transporter (DMT)-like permease